MARLSAVLGLTLLSHVAAFNVSQVHIAYGQNASTKMNVAWLSESDAAMTVKYGKTKLLLNMESVPASVSQYSFNKNYWAQSTLVNYTSDWIHSTNLTDLEPFTQYFYQVAGVSEIFNFTTALPPGHTRPDGKAQVFSIVGDIGQTNNSRLTMRHMMGENHKTDAAIVIGDLSYADCDQPRWDVSGDMFQPLAANHPFMVCPGNHEIEWLHNDYPTFLAYESRYFMPAVAPAQGMSGHVSWKANNDDLNDDDNPNPHWWDCTPSEFRGTYEYGNAFYSYTVGLVHFVSLNCYGPTSPGSTQYEWVEQDLASVNRDVVPWVVMYFHCPFYSTNSHHFDEWQTLEMKENMEELFRDYEVNLILSGHVHAYERSHPVFQDVVTKDAPTYVVVGDGGNREGHADGYNTSALWSAYRNDTEFGHGTLTVFNHTSMVWEWHLNEDPNWVVRDTAWVKRYAASDSNSEHSSHKYKSPLPPWLRVLILVFVAVSTVLIIGGACLWESRVVNADSDGRVLIKSDDIGQVSEGV